MCAALALLLLLSAAFGGCSPDSSSYDDTDPLEKFDGWWERPSDYESEGISMVDYFKVDAEYGTWTIYNKYGVEGDTFDCSAFDDELTLDLDALGDAVFYYDDETLTDEYGGVEFVRGEEIDPIYATYFNGTWFRYGDRSDSYYQIDGYDYQYFTPFSPDEAASVGTWSISDVTTILRDGSSVEEKRIEFDIEDAMFSDDYSVVCDDFVFLDTFHGDYFIKDDVIGSEEGDYYAAVCELVCNTWSTDGYDQPSLEFSFFGKFDLISYTNGYGERSTPGTWDYDGRYITLWFDNGAKELVEFSGTGSFTVDYYDGLEFSK